MTIITTQTVAWALERNAQLIMFEILLPALLGGTLLALMTGPLGCFVVWRRMAYFGDTLSHSALLGVALGLLLQVQPSLAVIAVCLLMAVLLTLLQQQRLLAMDTLLGILAHSALSLGLIAISFLPSLQLDLMAFLFGDLLALDLAQVGWIAAGVALVLGLLKWRWDDLIFATLHEDLAAVEGVNPVHTRFLLMALLSLVIAVAMKVVGVLLVTSLLIIPAATVRLLANSPEQMACLAAICGVTAVWGGLALSWFLDTPAGPGVVATAFMLFVLSFLWHQLQQRLVWRP